jgi:undecaprenyl-diphosphatase
MLNALAIFGATYLWYVIIGIAVPLLFLRPRREQIRLLIFAALALPLVYLVSIIGASLYYDPRPFVIGHFEPLIPHKPSNGFPSDHVLWSAAISAIIFPSEKYVSLLLWLLTLLVGMSRVYVGVHHPIDVLGSIGIAIGVVVLVHFVLRIINPFGYWTNCQATQTSTQSSERRKPEER